MNAARTLIVATSSRRLGYHGGVMRRWAAALFLVTLVVSGAFAGAATLSRTATATATVTAVAKLSLSATTLAFANADPDTTASIPATGGALTITAKARTTIGSTVTLTVLATNDLKSGTDTILATNLTWTATGTGFVAGTLSKTAAQSVGSWTSSGNWTGTQTYALANSWTYATGTYTTTLTYTLTAP